MRIELLQRGPGGEWLEADGLGGFASGTITGPRTRRYHALLLTATTPPTGRFALVNGVEAFVETERGRFALSTQRYAPDVLHPDGHRRLESFELEPWPTWRFRLEDGAELVQELFAVHDRPETVLSLRLAQGSGKERLLLRPLLSGRDYHALHHENPHFRFTPERRGAGLRFHPYPGVPDVLVASNGSYRHDPQWYRRFLYGEEQARGLDHLEDLASPGELSFELGQQEALLILRAGGDDAGTEDVRGYVERVRREERARRWRMSGPLARAADQYLVRRGSGRSIVAGYPWFTDWGRDTFIALRGLCLSTGRLEEARAILAAWAGTVSQGMLPNLFPDGAAEPEYNSVDASLWYVIAVHEYLARAGERRAEAPALRAAVLAILEGYARGTRFGIHMDHDGLLAAGEPGVQLTWMDAKVGGHVVTPRIGKPVEVQALWLNALAIGGAWDPVWRAAYARGLASFRARFWDEATGGLYDVVDVGHRPGVVDGSVRPNQIFAVGGLPLPLLDGPRARSVVDLVERELLTPLGLRSLAPGHPDYRGRYAGGVWERDTAYHQGTVWPWLIGAFVDAWLAVHGDGAAERQQARTRFLEPLRRHLREAGLGHVSEIADGDAPHRPAGCPFQAWSLGELLRVEERTALTPSATLPQLAP